MKRLKAIIETLIIYLSCQWIFKNYIKHYSLEENSFDKLFDFKYEKLLNIYISMKILSNYEITKVLNDCKCSIILRLVMNNRLDEKQQEILVKKNDFYLLEKYFNPKTGFDVSRRLLSNAEFLFITNCIKCNNPIAMSVFKLYVDNTISNLITADIFEIIILYNNWFSKYLIQKASLNEKFEQLLVENGHYDLIKAYISTSSLRNEKAQILLIDEYYDLTTEYVKSNRVTPKAYQHYKRNLHERI